MRLVKPDTWIIEPFCPSSDAPRVHLLIGETYALVIDPTDTPYDLRAYIQTYVTDKPLLVANTHSHNDHTYANYLFDDCTIYMSEICQQELRQARTHPPKLDALGHAYASYNEGTVVRPGDVIELGGRPVQVLGCTPCHAASSLLFLDEKAGILFTGDEIDAGQVNIWNQPVEVFRDNIVMLLGLRDRFDTICCPHNGTPMHADVLRYFLENWSISRYTIPAYYLFLMVGVTGIEPATSWSQTTRAPICATPREHLVFLEKTFSISTTRIILQYLI